VSGDARDTDAEIGDVGLAQTADPSDIRKSKPDEGALATGSRLDDTAMAATRASGSETALDETIDRGSMDGESQRESFRTVARDHYAVGEELARGGMGRILSARDRRLGRPVAIKELLRGSTSARARFEREALITAGLQHPAIVPIYEAGHWPDGEPFFSMKLVAGAPLDLVVRKCKSSEERLGLLHRVIDVADALAYAHSKDVIHRDLKPANVLVGDFGETVVIDWGLAKRLGEVEKEEESTTEEGKSAPSSAELTVLGQAIGTPAYMAPEQARGEEVDKRADVYSLGAMLYHVLSGNMAYAESKSAEDVLSKVLRGPPPPLETLVEGLPPELLTIVKKAMARSVKDRYQDAEAFADELRRFQSGQLVAAHSYSLRAHLMRWVRTHKTLVTTMGATLLVASVAAVWSIGSIREQRSKAMDANRIAQAEMKLAKEQKALADLRSQELALNVASSLTKEYPLEALEQLAALDLEDSPVLVARARSIAAQARSNRIPNELTALGEDHGPISLSPDGKYLAVAWNDKEVGLVDLKDKSRISLPDASFHNVQGLAFSPDSRFLAATGHTSPDQLLLWDMKTKAAPKVVGESARGGLFFSPDSQWLAYVRNGVHLVDLSFLPDGLQKKKITKYRVHDLDFSPDSKTLAMAADGVVLYQVETGETDTPLYAGPLNADGYRTNWFRSVHFSPDGTQLVAADERAILIDLATKEHREVMRFGGGFTAISFSLDSKMLAASVGEILHFFPAKHDKGVVTTVTGHKEPISWLAFGEDRRRLISSSHRGQLRQWNFSWMNGGNLLISHSVEVLATNMDDSTDPDMSTAGIIAAYDHRKMLRLWDRERPDARTLADEGRWLRSLFAPGDKLLGWTVGAQDHRVQVVGIDGVSRVLGEHGEQIEIFAMSSDDRFIVTGGGLSLKLWNVQEGTTTDLIGHETYMRNAFFAAGKLFTADLVGKIFAWELPGGKGELVADHGEKFLLGMVGVAVDPKGRWVATTGIKGKVFLHSLVDGSKRLLATGEPTVQGMAVNSQGDRLAMSLKRSEMTVFSPLTGEKVVLKSPMPMEKLIHPSFSPDGKSLVAANDLTGLRVWRDWQASEESSFLRGRGSSWHPEFSDDGKRVLAPGDPDGSASIWQVASGERRDMQGLDVTTRADFWPAAERIVTSSRDGFVTLWLDDLPRDWPSLRQWIRGQVKEHKFIEVR
jgi:serine/threonine protein kinase/WD40 repeat protein